MRAAAINACAKSPRIERKDGMGPYVILGTGISVEFIARRFMGGDSVQQLAREWKLSRTDIEEAIRCATMRR